MNESVRQDPPLKAVPGHGVPHPVTPLPELARALEVLRKSMLAFEHEHKELLSATSPTYRASARNLLHYLAMRRQDMRVLQTKLATRGLSSLGRAESHALSAVETVLQIVHQLNGTTEEVSTAAPCDHNSGGGLLDEHAAALLGPEPQTRTVRMMVTMPGEAASDYTIVRSLIDAGMDCMRINCAHDGPPAWQKMIEHLRHACRTSGRKCVVLMDLAGPKLRTGNVEPGPAVQKLRPKRDVFGHVVAPAVVWLTASNIPAPAPSAAAGGALQVDADWLATIELHDKIRFCDTRGRRRVLRVVDRDRGGVWAELRRTAYVTNGSKLRRVPAKAGAEVETEVSGIATIEGVIRVSPGDLLILTREGSPGRGPSVDSAGQLLSPARVSCTLPQV
ncbi:MAG TPA: pyruvate kinase, partial [Steroidobacteraceae bacterium]|nr:pyruvate kinase [Steroidobacteraceae bacterium]